MNNIRNNQTASIRCIYFLFTVTPFLLNAWPSSESNVDAVPKQKVNFRGKIITYQGQEYTVENMSIDNKYKQIPVYDLPATHESPHLNADTKQKEIIIDTSIDLITSKIDLSESSEIQVPHPDIIWVYEQKGTQKKELLEIEIISNISKTKRSYLLPKNIHIACDELDPAGPIEKKIPLSTIKNFIIESYSYRLGKNEVPQ